MSIIPLYRCKLCGERVDNPENLYYLFSSMVHNCNLCREDGITFSGVLEFIGWRNVPDDPENTPDSCEDGRETAFEG